MEFFGGGIGVIGVVDFFFDLVFGDVLSFFYEFFVWYDLLYEVDFFGFGCVGFLVFFVE